MTRRGERLTPTTNVDYRPGCACWISALEPNADCWFHGAPDPRQCPACGQFRGWKPCKRCGCGFGLLSGRINVEAR